MIKFAYDAPADVFSNDGVVVRKRPVSYRSFPSSAEAIRFTIEQLPQIMQRGAVMEVGDDRFDIEAIRALYDSESYPLMREAAD